MLMNGIISGKGGIVLRGVFGTVVAAVVVLIMATLLPQIVGMQSYVVYSGSMEPSIRTGDAVVVRPITAQELGVGDVITYRAPDKPNEFITHRIIEVRGTTSELSYLTKGDANSTLDLDEVRADRVVGKVVYPVPFAGYLLHFSNTPAGRLLLVAVPAILLLAGSVPGMPWGKKRLTASQQPAADTADGS
jgi:signal peptidase